MSRVNTELYNILMSPQIPTSKDQINMIDKGAPGEKRALPVNAKASNFYFLIKNIRGT